MYISADLYTIILVCFTISLTIICGLFYQLDCLRQNNPQCNDSTYLETDQLIPNKEVRSKYRRAKLFIVGEPPLHPIVVYYTKDDCTEKARKYCSKSY